MAKKNKFAKKLGRRAVNIAGSVARGLILGGGDYEIVGQASAPSFANSNEKLAYRNREMIGIIESSETIGETKIYKFPINPALLATFPWLSGLATSFELYKFLGWHLNLYRIQENR